MVTFRCLARFIVLLVLQYYRNCFSDFSILTSIVFKDAIASEKDPSKAIHFLKAVSSAWLISPQLHEDRVFLCHFGLSKPISFGVGGGRSHKLQYKVGHYKTIVNFKVWNNLNHCNSKLTMQKMVACNLTRHFDCSPIAKKDVKSCPWQIKQPLLIIL